MNMTYLDEVNARNEKLYEQARIALKDLKTPIREIPRHNQPTKTEYIGKDKNGVATFEINWW